MLAVKALYLGKDFKGDPPLYMKIAAGLTTGALAIAIASPTDLVKARPFTTLQKRRCVCASSSRRNFDITRL